MEIDRLGLTNAAWDVLSQSAKPFGFVATAQNKDNYARLWSRDSAISALAVLAHERTELYPTVLASINGLLEAVGEGGVFPSNVSFAPGGERTGQSYGGPVGRTDSPFWWAIMALSYLEKVKDVALEERVAAAIDQVEQRALAWEFNNKHLMYAPASSNWADEYPVEGYILLNNVLRFWMLKKAAIQFAKQEYREKSNRILWSIKAHFFGEPADAPNIFTAAQQEQLESLENGGRLLMSFTPGKINTHIDSLGWSVAMLCGAASEATKRKMIDRWSEATLQEGLAPAHWPIIEPGMAHWEEIASNYGYAFKNHPGHFHNGGVWGLTQGFTAAALCASRIEEGGAVLDTFEKLLVDNQENHPFAEYYSYPELAPGGVERLCFSAAGYLLALAAKDGMPGLAKVFAYQALDAAKVEALASKLASEIMADGKAKVYRVAGESGCGKTTLAKALKTEAERQGKVAVVVSQDEFFKLPPRQNHNKRVEDFSWIGPGEVDFELLRSKIAEVLDPATSEVQLPKMNWEKDTLESETVWCEGVDCVIVEGTYVLEDLAEDECAVFFAHTCIDTREARIARNREVVDDFIARVLAKEHELIAPYGEKAHYIITTDYQLEKRTT